VATAEPASSVARMMVFMGLLLGFKVQIQLLADQLASCAPALPVRVMPPRARDLKYRLPLKSMPRRYD